ncbi:class I SAM-dependent methyltransferase [Candidatus Sumerlaeota bacterium]|nr:class I SAM-dependent methyltransferase [Candidatus Sumerlaeota bacterium]
MDQPAAAMNETEKVQQHYNSFPFPKAAEIQWNPWMLWELNTLAGRWGAKPIPEDGRILIAGCGTVEAVMWAKSCPQAELYGVDLSSESIAITRSLIEQLRLSNVRVEQRSLLELNESDGEFDLISSYGVLHHLKDPREGLSVLRRRLKPDGVMNLMLYNRRNRYFLREFQGLVELLCPDDAAESREAMGKSLTFDLLADDSRLRETQQYASAQYENDRPYWADACVHPLEHDYNLDELFALLKNTGMQMLNWRNPRNWHVAPWLGSPALKERFAALPLQSQWEFADRLRMPLFEMLCGRDEDAAPEFPWLENDEALLEMVFVNPTIYRLEVKSNIVVGKPSTSRGCGFEAIPGQPDRMKIHTPGGLHLTAHPFFQILINQLDGQKTLRQAGECAAQQAGVEFSAIRQTAVGVMRKLLIPHQGLVCSPA